MLEQHWNAPIAKKLTLIKRNFNTVYSAVLQNNHKVVVKTNQTNMLHSETNLKHQMFFLNYLHERGLKVTPFVGIGYKTGSSLQIQV